MNSENPAFDPTRLLLALRRSNLFASLSAEAMAALEAQLTPVTLMSGEVLFKEGEPSDSLYIVISGRLRVVSRAPEDQSERLVADLGHGEIVGEMGLVCDEPRSATVVAIRDTNLAKLTEAGLNRLAASCAQPIYSAIIKVHIAYGFASVRKLDLQVGTNVDGKARFIGLPDRLKRGLYFEASESDRSGEAFDDPEKTCQAQFTIALQKKSQ